MMIEILIHLSKKVIDLFFDLFVNPTKKEILEQNEEELKAYKEEFGKKVGLILGTTVIIGLGSFYLIQNTQNPTENIPPQIVNTEINFNHLENVHSNYFNFVRIENNSELVQGFKGSYYYVDFLLDIEDATKKEIFFFEKGKYFIEKRERRKKFELAVKAFTNDIIKATKKSGQDYEIFIRGKADILPIRGIKKLNQDYRFREILYIQRISNTKYNPKRIFTHYINDDLIENDDLPFLRAQFIKDYFGKRKSNLLKIPIVLEGTVSSNVSEYDRNVEIIFFSPVR